MTDKPRSVLGILLLTVLIDMVGFSVIFPLFPQMLTYYVELEGAGSMVGRLVATLVRIGGSEVAVVTLFGGILGSVYSLLQFLFAPVWGGLSDRIGRRPTLLITLAGTALSHLIWFVSGSFLMLLAARTVGGIMAGNISTATAVVADTYEGRQRAKGMGMLGACIGLGFIIGPAIGALTARFNLLEFWPGGASFGINPFSVCALAAFGLGLVNLAWAAARLYETYPPERRGQGETEAAGRTIHPLAALRGIDYPGVRGTNLAYLLFTVAFAALEFTVVFLAFDRLGYAPRDNMWLFIFMGLIIIVVQGGIVRRIVPRMGERSVSTWGIAVTLPGFVLIGMAESSAALYAGLALVSIGSGLVLPCMSALVSRYAPEDRQGLALGVFRSNGALARAIGPFAGGLLYWQLGSWAPYYLGAGLLVLPLVMTLTLPPVADHPSIGQP